VACQPRWQTRPLSPGVPFDAEDDAVLYLRTIILQRHVTTLPPAL